MIRGIGVDHGGFIEVGKSSVVILDIVIKGADSGFKVGLDPVDSLAICRQDTVQGLFRPVGGQSGLDIQIRKLSPDLGDIGGYRGELPVPNIPY